MAYQHIIYHVKDFVATLTLNRPERMNATIWPMRQEIVDALGQASEDDAVRAVVLTGAGKAFCAGLDVKAKAEGVNDTPVHLRLAMHPVAAAFLKIEKPVIAAINGVAVGAGFEMTVLSDFRFAAPGVRMGDLHVQRNLVPDLGAPWFLPRLIGWSRATEIILSGDLMTSEAARDIGLVHGVVPLEDLMPYSLEYAQKLARNAPQAMQLCKRMMRRALVSGPDEILHMGLMLDGYLMETADFKEALAAFAAKRPAVFTGQ